MFPDHNAARLSGCFGKAFATRRNRPVNVRVAVRCRHEQRLKLRWREKNPPVEHISEKRGEAPRVALFRISIILDRFAGKEKCEQRTYSDGPCGDADFPYCRVDSVAQALRSRIK